MESIIYRKNIIGVKETNEICNCSCDLKVIKNVSCETEYKTDYISKYETKYSEISIISAYCSECNNLYQIKIKYIATSKTDDEEMIYIKKKNYFELIDYLKELENNYKENNSYSIYLDNYIIQVLKNKESENFNRKIISYYNASNDLDYIKDKNICYNCDNKIFKNEKIKCLIHNQIFGKDYTCKQFDSIYK